VPLSHPGDRMSSRPQVARVFTTSFFSFFTLNHSIDYCFATRNLPHSLLICSRLMEQPLVVFLAGHANDILAVLTSSNLTVNNFMCSQSGNIQDLAACSGHSPSCIIGSNAEPDNVSRQEFVHPPSLPSDMGLRYMTIPPLDDVR
jgi:hypothetical protein